MHKKGYCLFTILSGFYFIDSGISIIPSLYVWRNVEIESKTIIDYQYSSELR